MQSVKIGKLLRQLAVLISRNFQLIWNQKLTLGSLILQAPLMVLVIKLVGEPDCFTSNLINIGSRTVLFIVCAMASFMGLLNSYREICKDREIIFREASVGVSLLATVLSKAITLFLVEAVQAGILTAGFVEIIHIPQNHLLLDTNAEIFITIFLLMAASSAMGLLVSASLKSSEAAVLLVLVIIPGVGVYINGSRRWLSLGLNALMVTELFTNFIRGHFCLNRCKKVTELWILFAVKSLYCSSVKIFNGGLS